MNYEFHIEYPKARAVHLGRSPLGPPTRRLGEGNEESPSEAHSSPNLLMHGSGRQESGQSTQVDPRLLHIKNGLDHLLYMLGEALADLRQEDARNYPS